MKLFLAIILLSFTWSYLNADNPVVKGKGHGDPHIRIFNDKVYIYVSHDVDPNAKDFVMRDWYVLSSDDMIKWDVKCILKAEDTYIGANDHCWAVDAASRNGKYYLYFSEWNRQTGVAVCDTPDGKFKDALNGPLLPENISPTREYDPAIYIDDDKDKTPYLVFGGPKWAYGDTGDDYYIVKLNDDMISLAGKPQKLPVNCNVDDKPSLHKHNGIYYLSWASNYATSKNLFGPYTYRGNIKASLDHGSFIEWNNQWFNAFTIFDPQVFYRATGLTYIHYKKDGSIADVDPLILKYGVGQYESTWERIEAEWHMAANDDSRKEELENSGFAVVNEERKIELKYPNIHNMSENALMNIRLNTKQNGWIKIYDTSTGRILGKERINASNDWQNIQIRLKNPKGDNNITIKTPKNIYIDYFSFD